MGYQACERNTDVVEPDDLATENALPTPESLFSPSSINLDGAEWIQLTSLKGGKESYYRLEGDILVSPEEYEALQSPAKHYVSTNLVECPRSIIISGGNPFGPGGLPPSLWEALEEAVDLYNGLYHHRYFRLQFELYPHFAFDDGDIKVFIDPGLSPTHDPPAMAGFPTDDGLPFPEIRLNPVIETWNPDALLYFMLHEIGHCIGYRHTDWIVHESCSNSNGEPEEPYGAHHVGGTPTAWDYWSVMNACYHPNRFLGTFSTHDVNAFYNVYNDSYCEVVIDPPTPMPPTLPPLFPR